MKKLKSLIFVVMCLFLCACSSGDDYVTYTYLQENQAAPYTLTLNEKDSTFQFVYAKAQYMPYGEYTIEGNMMKLVTNDYKYNWNFEIQDDGSLKFVAEGSTESLVDGTVFTKKEQ